MKNISHIALGIQKESFSMSKLMRATKWAHREFEAGSRPTNKTIRSWIEDGIIKGEIINKDVYVFSDSSFNHQHDIEKTVSSLIEMSI